MARRKPTVTSAKHLSVRPSRSRAAPPDDIPGIASPEGLSRQAIRLSFLIHDVSRMRRTAFDQLMKPYGVTRAQWWVLAHLSRNDGMMQTQLADALDVGKASLGTFIERLEASGLVERRDDPIDQRAKRVYMSRAGQKLLKQMTLEENRLNELILIDLSAAERDSMIGQMSGIKRTLAKLISSGNLVDGD
jgi:MarR family transcriptional regulator for hemolysin